MQSGTTSVNGLGEAGEMRLQDTSGLSVRFSAQGQLLSLEREGCAWSFVAPCHGWALRTAWDDANPGMLRPGPAARVTQPDATHLVVELDRLQYDDGREVEAAVELVWEVADGLLLGRLARLELPEGLKPVALACPDVRVPYGDGAQWLVPHDLGMVVDAPLAQAVDAPDMSAHSRMRAHMQFTAWLAGGIGLHLAGRDTEGWMKSLLLRVGQGTAEVCLEHLLPQPVSGRPEFPRYAVSLAPFVGGWYEAAQVYRPWALQQYWAARGPEQRRDTYVAEVACWLWLRGRISNVCPPAKEVARRLGLPVALDWYWWHKNPYDTSYPDYFPPREGAEAFSAAVADLQQHGVSTQVYTNGMSWDREEPRWETDGRACTTVLRDGEYWGHVYNTWANRRLMHTCGAADGWHRQALITADGVAALGLDGLYMDQIAIVGGTTPCFSTEHGHVPGGGSYGVQGFRDLFRKVRARHPNLVLSSESVAEVYQDLLDCCITLHTSWEASCGAAGCQHANLVPLFPAVYHGRAVVFGNYAHIDGITPYDELWPQDARPDPSEERDWHALCPDQFALDMARTVACGCQPLATNLTAQHLSSPDLAADVAFFLDLARFFHAHREWLLWGDMLAPGTVDCETVEVTCIQRSIFTPPSTIEPFTVQRPAVLHSAWRSPDGAAGLFLFNYTRTEQTVTITRSDGLVPDGEPSTLTLPPRSMRCVPLVSSP
ncbi:DUF6259 domain-containing protein [bacterium]|nr:DUF6259 domain-containing protein [bacterium]